MKCHWCLRPTQKDHSHLFGYKRMCYNCEADHIDKIKEDIRQHLTDHPPYRDLKPVATTVILLTFRHVMRIATV